MDWHFVYHVIQFSALRRGFPEMTFSTGQDQSAFPLIRLRVKLRPSVVEVPIYQDEDGGREGKV